MIRFFHVASGHEGREVLRDASFVVEPGEIVLLRGATGAGKTTLLRLLLGAVRPMRGQVSLAGIEVPSAPPDVLATLRRRLAVIAQEPVLIAALSAVRNVAIALEICGEAPAAAAARANQILEALGLLGVAQRPAGELSPGEQRWVSIARALVRDEAPAILADEPTADLDSAGALALTTLLDERRRAGAAVLVTTRHVEAGTLEAVASRVLTLEAGRLHERPEAPSAPAKLRVLARRA